MSMPQTTLAVCKGVPLTNKYDHTILFESPEAQRAYFTSKRVKIWDDYVYLRKTWDIQVETPTATAREWNYLYFHNNDGKTFYYFITDVEYVNDRLTRLHLELDVMQTYMFDWELLATMVEREHSPTDAWGENTMDEGLDTGEYVNNGSMTQPTCLERLIPLVASTVDLTDGKTNVGGVYLAGCVSGAKVYACRSIQAFKTAMGRLTDEAKSDAILSVWMYPEDLVTGLHGEWAEVEGGTLEPEEVFASATTRFVEIAPQKTIDGYAPKNKKLLQFPYNVLYISNNNGGHADYRYEWFAHDGAMPATLNFGIDGTPAPDTGMKIYPIGYRGVGVTSSNFDDGLDLLHFPTCSWQHDSYTLWLNQTKASRTVTDVTNGGQIGLGVAAIVAGLAGFIPTGGASTGAVMAGAGMVMSGLTGTVNQMAQYQDRSTQPPSARGNTSATLNAGAGLWNFSIYKKSVDRYHAQIIDDFFTMYGYKTMRVKIPEVNTRPQFNYVKVIGQAVKGDIPHVDLSKINDIFNKGVTFWHDPEHVGDYSINNAPFVG